MKTIIMLMLSLLLIACEKEKIEQPVIEQKLYHNVQVSYDNKKWTNYVLEEKQTLSFKNTYRGVFYIWAKDEKYSIKDTFKYYGSPKILYYNNGVLKLKE